MRCAITLSAVLGLFATGLGCHHVAGKCDCTYDPASFTLPTPNQPYAQIGSPMSGKPATDAAAPVQQKMPPARELPNGQ